MHKGRERKREREKEREREREVEGRETKSLFALLVTLRREKSVMRIGGRVVVVGVVGYGQHFDPLYLE